MLEHTFLIPKKQHEEVPMLKQLYALYIENASSFWKDNSVQEWLKANLEVVLARVDNRMLLKKIILGFTILR